ncbi:MAG: cyclic nucleotide-binding domain-containing protein, partial [Chloroflexota bacterium]|nr:cyclic nucleotide-binding domain-containing protein [Chloroflexota bacterium]
NNLHNANPKDSMPFKVRIGINLGPVIKEVDFDDRENYWGDGINISARVMSMAKPGQILVSKSYYEQARLSSWPKVRPTIKVNHVGKWWTKHNHLIDIYNVYDEFGDIASGLPPADIAEWYEPFNHPMTQVVTIYEDMMNDLVESRRSFRAAMAAKRLIDLVPNHEGATKVIMSISSTYHRLTPGDEKLHNPFFSPLSPSALMHFFSNADFTKFKTGKVVVKQNENADSMMIVVSGEIIPTIAGNRIRNSELIKFDDREWLSFQEGDIIGEMGFFNPRGKRTATLTAYQDTILLIFRYSLLNFDPKKNYLDTGTQSNRREIRDHIWQYYCRRMKQNRLIQHTIFQSLSELEKFKLLKLSKFLPKHPNDDLSLSLDDIRNNLIIVISGSITILSTKNKVTEYTKGNCLGVSNYILKENSPYSKIIDFDARTHVILYPWDYVQKLTQSNFKFRNDCAIIANDERLHLGLIL